MKRVSTILLTSMAFRELITPHAQGWFCDCRRKTDDNECVANRDRSGRFLALTKQDLKSGKNIVLFSGPASYGCHSVLFEGAGQGQVVSSRCRPQSPLSRAHQPLSHETCEQDWRHFCTVRLARISSREVRLEFIVCLRLPLSFS